MKISGNQNLTGLQGTKSTGKGKETPLFTDNDKVSISGGAKTEEASFLKMFKSPAYTKEQAMFELMDAEGSADQAMENLKIIEGNMKKDETLKEVTGQFIRLLNFRGNSKTKEVRNDFTTIGNSLKSGETRKEVTDLFVKLSNAENSIDQGLENHCFLDDHVTDRSPRKELTEQFIRMLNFEGTDKTKEVREHFNIIEDSVKSGETRQKNLDEFIKLSNAENSIEQGMENYRFLDNQVTDRTPRKELTEQFIRMLNFEGTDKTKEVREHFNIIEDSVKSGETRQKNLDEFIKLSNAENSIEQGMENYRFLDGHITDRTPRQELTEQFIRMLKFEGTGKTKEVREHFNIIEDSVKSGETRQEALNEFIRLSNAENSIDQGLGNYQLIDKYVKKDRPRKELTAQFIRILNTAGTSKTEEAREMFKLVNQYVSKEKSGQELTDQFIRILNMVGPSQPNKAMEMFKQLNG